MALNSKHPLYNERIVDWKQLRDSYAGETVIKARGTDYLPATSGMLEDGMTNAQDEGTRAYNAYRMRAVYPEIFEDAVKGALGAMHNKPPTIDLPEAMEDIRDNATLQGESLEMLLRRINEAQIAVGRIGLMADLPNADPTGFDDDGNLVAKPVPGDEIRDTPYIATYEAETIINWDAGTRFGLGKRELNVVVLDETGFVRLDNFEWKKQESYRVLVLGDVLDNEGKATGRTYRQGSFTGTNQSFSEEGLMEPSIMGNTLEEIPFVFINTSDLVPEPDKPPLLGLSHRLLAIYRGEADYRQNLFLQGQDTLVIIGQPNPATGGDSESDGDQRTGAGSVIYLQNHEADAKYIGVESAGLPEQRNALENDYKTAREKAGLLLDDVSRQRESGDALQVRVAARTATLTEIALTGAQGLQNILRIIARWRGLNEEDVVVTPNLDFVDDSIQAIEVVQLQTAKNLGAPISRQSMHGYFARRGLTELTFDEELDLIEQEVPEGGGSTAEDGPEDDLDIEE